MGTKSIKFFTGKGLRAPLLGLMGIGVTVASAFILYRKGVPAMSANPDDPSRVEAPEPTTTPPIRALTKSQTIMGCIGSVLFLSVVIGVAVFFGIRGMDPDEVADTFSIPTPTPVTGTPTPNPTEVVETLFSELEKTCPPLIATYASMTEQGYEYSEIVMSLANNFNMTPKKTNEVMMLCAQYGKAVIENQR